jgi:predicted enzyme related to lactoylglutathione lyase
MDRMYQFYADVFGLAVTAGDPDHGFVKFDVGSCELALHAGRDGDVGQYAPKVVFEVDDLAAARDHRAEHGVDRSEPRNPGPDVHVIDGRDPEGNLSSRRRRRRGPARPRLTRCRTSRTSRR